MGYAITAAADAMEIGEATFVRDAAKVKFSKITSCVGVITLSEGKLNAVHLVAQVNKEVFDKANAEWIKGQFPKAWTAAAFVGWVKAWCDENPAFKDLYDHFKGKLKYPYLAEDSSGDGIYSAEIEDATVWGGENGQCITIGWNPLPKVSKK